CTAQVLLSVMAGMYAVYHGPNGLRKIAGRIHGLAQMLEAGLQKLGIKQVNANYFDTLKVEVANPQEMKTRAEAAGMNFRYFATHHIGISLDETSSVESLKSILAIFASATGQAAPTSLQPIPSLKFSGSLVRKSSYLTHPVFNTYHSEHEMLRYIKKLENKDLSMVHSMISLGSCTMKLNATAEMTPVTWPELGQIHPFAPASQTLGYQEMINNLEKWLMEVTGFTGVSLQPNSGAQGEYAGLMVIRAYHQHRGDHHRNIALIPA
ncbi:MAG TPA: glycine dehydrogenase (aminomethyl-transferring), partial [Cytophagales bacterium]|nr:glycine dehydrogenase (aminomethyl-transferring) [Cytophagales bacterium]